jgi:hypothetical protein
MPEAIGSPIGMGGDDTVQVVSDAAIGTRSNPFDKVFMDRARRAAQRPIQENVVPR